MRGEAILAWHQHPEPAGTAYFARHLRDAGAVAEIFRHAKVLRAIITRDGWKHLWRTFGLGGLIDINREARWFNPSDERGVAEALLQQALIAGFNPSALELAESL